MNQARWTLLLDSAYNTASMTGQDEPHVIETRRGIEEASKGWDKDGKVLVLGCGDGTELNHFRTLGFKNVWGVTRHPVEAASGIEGVVNADIHNLPFDEDTFDYVYSKETLEHLLAPFVGVYEAARVMKAAGRFAHFISVGEAKQREWYHFSCFPDWVWYDLFRKSGLFVKNIRHVMINGNRENQILLEGIHGSRRDLTQMPVRHYGLEAEVEKARKPDLFLL